jgi:hypothetical protein
VKRAGYCYGHYMKNWRYGTPTPTHTPRWDDIIGQRFGSLVVTGERDGMFWICQCDCGQVAKALAGGLNRGSAASCGDRRVHHRSDDAGYGAAHGRLNQDRGRAKTHACIDCSNPAQHWSYNHDDPDELIAYGLSANGVAYSLDSSHYSPRCVPCHKIFDLHRIDSLITVA